MPSLLDPNTPLVAAGDNLDPTTPLTIPDPNDGLNTVDSLVAEAKDQFQELAQAVIDGDLTLDEFQAEMEDKIQEIHLVAFLAAGAVMAIGEESPEEAEIRQAVEDFAAGQLDEGDFQDLMDQPTDSGGTGWHLLPFLLGSAFAAAAIGSQLDYFSGLIDQLDSGDQPLDGSLVNRAGMYADAAFGSFQEATRIQAGMGDVPVGDGEEPPAEPGAGAVLWERRILEGQDAKYSQFATATTTKPATVKPVAVDHCDDCLEYAAEGWAPIDTLPAIGQSVCLTRCRCHFVFSSATEEPDVSDVTGDFSMDHAGRERLRRARRLAFFYSADQARDAGGRWTTGGAGPGEVGVVGQRAGPNGPQQRVMRESAVLRGWAAGGPAPVPSPSANPAIAIGGHQGQGAGGAPGQFDPSNHALPAVKQAHALIKDMKATGWEDAKGALLLNAMNKMGVREMRQLKALHDIPGGGGANKAAVNANIVQKLKAQVGTPGTFAPAAAQAGAAAADRAARVAAAPVPVPSGPTVVAPVGQGNFPGITPDTVNPLPANDAWHKKIADPANTVVEQRVLGNRGMGNVNTSYAVTLRDGSKGAFKPLSGEGNSARSNVDGDLYKREAAVSDIAQVVGMGDLVPQTVLKDIPPMGIGSFQAFAPNAQEANDVGARKMFDGATDLARSAAFDVMIGHSDRHAKNWMVDNTSGKLILIDNGYALPDRHEEEGGNHEIIDRAARDHLTVPAEVANWKWPAVQAVLKNSGLSDQVIANTKLRFDAVKASAGKPFNDIQKQKGFPKSYFYDTPLALSASEM